MTRVAPFPMKAKRRASWQQVVEEPKAARCCTLAKSYRGWLRFLNALFMLSGVAIIGFMVTLRFLSASTGINPAYVPDMSSFILGAAIGGYLVLIALAGYYAGKGSKIAQWAYAFMTLLSLGCVIAAVVFMMGWKETDDVAHVDTKEIDMIDNVMRGKFVTDTRTAGRSRGVLGCCFSAAATGS